MSESLIEQVAACSAAIQTAIIDSLNERAEYIAAIERTKRGDLPISGIALELSPWHGGLSLSLRLTSDFPLGQSRYDSADWTHFDFTSECESPTIEQAVKQITAIYERGNMPGYDLREMAHLTFLAGAEALLHPNVAQVLNQFDIKGPEISDAFVSSSFEYILTDVDQTVKSNYCDLVLANRVTRRVLASTA